MPKEDFSPNVEYRPIPGFSAYKAGSDGTVWSCRKVRVGITDEWSRLKGDIRRRKNGKAYIFYRLVRDDGKTQAKAGHQLVLMAFISPRPEGKCACHENDDGLDNRIENLRWDTMKANIADRTRNGGTKSGEKNHFSVITDEEAKRIVSLIRRGYSNAEIARVVGIGANGVGEIRGGRCRRSLWSGGYKWIPTGRGTKPRDVLPF